MGSGPSGIKLGTKNVIYHQSYQFSLEKRYLCQQTGKCLLRHLNLYFRVQNILQKGDPIELNFEDLETQKWNIPTDRAQKLVEKNWAIYLIIMFTPTVMTIRMLKVAHFLYFLLMAAES